ncbi:MAG: T9SS type A sorting domain-containing protein, partial [Calditrichales bacterium]
LTNDSRLIFKGDGDQILDDAGGNKLSHLVIQKSGGLLYLADTLCITDSVSLVSGNLITADTSVLLLAVAAEVSAGAITSFIDGPVIKVFPVSAIADSFLFPTGDQQDFRPLTVYMTDISTDSLLIRVEQINQSAAGLSTNRINIDKVSEQRYWHIAKEGPGTFSTARVTLTYDTVATGDGVGVGKELRVAYLDTTDVWTWHNLGGEGTKNDAGSIKSNMFSDFASGYFTFGDATGGADISLPVLLSLFDLAEKRGEVTVTWKSESEIDNLYWLVQRKEESDSTAQFETIARVEGRLTTSTATDYSIIDNGVELNRTYAYRLADISTSGRHHFHDPVLITIGLPQTYQLHQNYPNPFNASTTIAYDLPRHSEVHIEIYNIMGQKVATLVNEKQKPGYYKLIWDSTNRQGNPVASGMYFVTIKSEGAKDGKVEQYHKAQKIVLVK